MDDNDLIEALHRAHPLSGDYVTQSQLASSLSHMETKLSNSELRQRNWVLVGCLAIIVTFGGGYISLVSKLDRITETLPAITASVNTNRAWLLRKDRQDETQDTILKQVVPGYSPEPYIAPPQ